MDQNQNNLTPTPEASTPASSSPAEATPAAAPTLPKNASAEDVLNFNPFAKGASAAPGPKTEPTPAAAPAQTPAAAASPGGATPVGTPSNSPEVAAIQALLLQGADGGLPQGGGQPPAPGQQQDDPFVVNWPVPEQLAAGLLSGDPNQAVPALNALANGLANGVLGTVKERLNELVTQALPQMMERAIAMREANQAFYGDFPHLKAQQVRDLTARVAQAVAQTWRNAGRAVDPMDPAFRDAVEGFMVAQGMVQRPQDWKHPRMAPPAPPPQPRPHFGSNTAPSVVNGGAPTGDLLGSIGL